MAHIPRPDHAFVGNHTYRIEWLSQDEWDNAHLDQDSDACTYASKQVMYFRLLDGAQESHYQELMVHELTHAVWDSTMLTHVTLSDQTDPEEFIIGLQSPALLFILKMNEVVTKWILSDGTVVR